MVSTQILCLDESDALNQQCPQLAINVMLMREVTADVPDQ
jgi:hypothetical protein